MPVHICFSQPLGPRFLHLRTSRLLVFHKYGDQYFLEQIWSGGEQEGTQVPESPGERTARRQLAQTQQSNMSGKVTRAETVDIAPLLHHQPSFSATYTDRPQMAFLRVWGNLLECFYRSNCDN